MSEMDAAARLRNWRAQVRKGAIPGYDHMRSIAYPDAPVCDADVDVVLDELEQLRTERRRQIDLAYSAGWYDATYQAVAGRGPDMKGQVAGLRKYHQELEAHSPDADGAR